MNLRDANSLVNAIHRNQYFRPTEEEREFLENMSFMLTMDKAPKITKKQGDMLQELYRQSQGG